MPNVRRRVRRIVRRRIRDRVRRLSGQPSALRLLLVLTFVSVAAAAAFVCIEPPASSACPEVFKVKTLRVLYKESALVAVARVGDSVAIATGEVTTFKKTALHISSLLKGESKERGVNLYHYVRKDEEADESSQTAYEKNDVLLVFLKAREDGDGYEPADDERGVRMLPPDDLKVYVKRIEELAVIMRSEKPDPAALTEWLVRCAEEHATRWEGAYELAFDASLFGAGRAIHPDLPLVAPKAEFFVVEVVGDDEGQAKHDDNSAARVATTEAAAHNQADESGARVEPGEVVSPATKAEEKIDFAELLTTAHKERLTNALLAAEELQEGDEMLLRLVGNWKDARLVPYSLKHLAHMVDQPPPQAEDLMRLVAHTRADETLIEFVNDYSSAAPYDDLNHDREEFIEKEFSEATPELRAEKKKMLEEMKAADAKARLQRSSKLRHFLALAAQSQMP